MAKPKFYWIKERFNPQLGTYYIPMGPLSLKEAAKYERAAYGTNIMHRYSSVEEYTARVNELKEQKLVN